MSRAEPEYMDIPPPPTNERSSFAPGFIMVAFLLQRKIEQDDVGPMTRRRTGSVESCCVQTDNS